MAASILVFAIATSIVALQAGFKTLDVARGTTLASQIAQSEIERVRLMSWADVSALPASAAVDISSIFTTDPALAARFSVERVVQDVAGMNGLMREITLHVTWKSYDGRAHTRSFITRYSRNGLYDYYYTLARS